MKHPKKAQASVEITKRSKLVADTAKARAKGHCQLCKKPASFFYGDGKEEMIRMEELNAARAELNNTTGEKPVTQKMFRAI